MLNSPLQLKSSKKSSKCGPGCRCKNCGNTTSYPHAQQHHLEEIVEEGFLEVDQEELPHDEMLKEEYREESVDCDSEEDIIHDFILVYEEVRDFGLLDSIYRADRCSRHHAQREKTHYAVFYSNILSVFFS